jgi:Fe-S cluster assembly ATP-binding protein
MKKKMLKIKNLCVSVNNKGILRNVNVEIKRNEIQALLGPNASGKSTLAYTIMGMPNYKITKGKIFFEGKNITRLPPEKRSKLGIALAFQTPPTIKGVKLSKLLEKISMKKINEKEIGIDHQLLERDINVGFSGGEKKLSEIIQIFSLNPKLVILDEIDSGLDIKKVEKLTTLIRDKLLNNVSILLITHRDNILRSFDPDVVNVMLDGEIVCKSKNWRKIWKTITRYEYEKCRECRLSTC